MTALDAAFSDLVVAVAGFASLAVPLGGSDVSEEAADMLTSLLEPIRGGFTVGLGCQVAQ